MKNDHYLVKGEVFTNPFPKNMIDIDLTEYGNYLEDGIGTHLIVGSTAHDKLDNELCCTCRRHDMSSEATRVVSSRHVI